MEGRWSRTWELELFISGAIIFSLYQAVGPIDSWWVHTRPHLDGAAEMMAFFAYYYSKLIVYALAATFTIHLIARTFWVGAVGLHSVFPQGPDYSKLPWGPITRTEMSRRLPLLPEIIEKVDNFSSVIFAAGGLMVITFVMSVVLASFAMALSSLVTWAVGGNPVWLFFGFLFVVSLVPSLIVNYDRTHGHKVAEGSVMHRMIRRVAIVNYHLYFQKFAGPLSSVLSSNIPKRTFYGAFFGVFVVLIVAFFFTDPRIRQSAGPISTFDYLPSQRSTSELNPFYYEDQREEGSVFENLPSISSQVVTGPYLQLFVPITPSRHDPLITERCPDVKKPARGRLFGSSRGVVDASIMNPLLECLAGLQPVSLDGQRIAPTYKLAVHPTSRIRGISAQIPLHAVAPGEHLLQVEGLPRPRSSKQPPRDPHFIPFWK